MDNQIEAVLAKLNDGSKSYLGQELTRPLEIVKKVNRPYSKVFRIRAVFEKREAFFWIKTFRIRNRLKSAAEKHLQRVATEFDAAAQLQGYFAGEQYLHIIDPIAFFPELATIVTWESRGEPLSDLIAKKARFQPDESAIKELEQYAFRCGEALQKIQHATRGAEIYNPAELLEYVDLRLQRLESRRGTGFGDDMRKLVFSYIERMIPRVSPEHCWSCGVHSDYGPFNILAGNGEITVTDFTMYSTGSAYKDLTYFFHRLGGFLHKPMYRQETIQRLQQTFLQGWGEPAVQEHALFKLFWVRHTVNNYSAIGRNRTAGPIKRWLPHVRLYNKHVFNNYSRWLRELCMM